MQECIESFNDTRGKQERIVAVNIVERCWGLQTSSGHTWPTLLPGPLGAASLSAPLNRDRPAVPVTLSYPFQCLGTY